VIDQVLNTWTTLTNIIATTLPINVTDLSASNASARFPPSICNRKLTCKNAKSYTNDLTPKTTPAVDSRFSLRSCVIFDKIYRM
jgi:hypothetical protein